MQNISKIVPKRILQTRAVWAFLVSSNINMYVTHTLF